MLTFTFCFNLEDWGFHLQTIYFVVTYSCMKSFESPTSLQAVIKRARSFVVELKASDFSRLFHKTAFTYNMGLCSVTQFEGISSLHSTNTKWGEDCCGDKGEEWLYGGSILCQFDRYITSILPVVATIT